MDALGVQDSAGAAQAARVAEQARWQVRLLGAVEATDGLVRLDRFPSRAVALLLARLALEPHRAHSREELIELLWPGVALDVGRNRLRQTLSSLKNLLEPAGAEATHVLGADRLSIRVLPGAFDCDVGRFERHVRAGENQAARVAYGGPLIPGYYDEWVVQERQRLADLFEPLAASASGLQPDAPPAAAKAGASPPVAPALPAPSSLPSFWTRSIGTELSASRLRVLVGAQRLVTVHGPGGSGKTRLAVEVASALRDEALPALAELRERSSFERVAFVSLVDCSGAAQVLDAISTALRAGHDGSARNRITSVLARGPALLVLDNCEQLEPAAGDEIEQLLRALPQLHLLCTSRRLLDLDGEQAFALDGLALPAEGATLADAAACPAVQLFVDRARAARADFRLHAGNATAICGLVRLLSGMPLAIELAASRVRALAPGELLQRLATDSGTPALDLLARQAARAAEAKANANANEGAAPLQTTPASRHASMRHVVGWSWQQLSPPLVELMHALATFAVPARVETVAAVAGLDVATARERLEQLHDHSLVSMPADATGTPRSALLQPVREFVAERCPQALAAACRQRLRQWLLAFGRRCAGEAQRAIFEVEAELPQLYAAVLAACAEGAFSEAAELVVVLRRHWEIDTRAGLPAAVQQALLAAQPHLPDPGQRCETCVLLAFSSTMAGQGTQALELSQQALALAPDGRRRAQALLRVVQATLFSGADASALDPLLAEVLALARAAGDPETEGIALRMAFLLAVNRDDDHVRGEPMAEQAQQVWERLGHRRNAYTALMDRASCWIAQSRFEQAATALTSCEQVAHEERYPTGYITASWQLGRVQMKRRRAEDALAAFRRCVRESWRHHRMGYVADALVLTPGGLALCGHSETAARLYGFATAHWQKQFGAFYRDLDRDLRVTRRLLLKRLGPVRFEALRLRGTGLSLSAAVDLALGDD